MIDACLLSPLRQAAISNIVFSVMIVFCMLFATPAALLIALDEAGIHICQIVDVILQLLMGDGASEEVVATRQEIVFTMTPTLWPVVAIYRRWLFIGAECPSKRLARDGNVLEDRLCSTPTR